MSEFKPAERYAVLTPADWRRFDAKRVITESGCVEWTGRSIKRRSGHAYFHLVRAGRRQTFLVHRMAFLRANGYLTEVIRHSCDNPLCTAEAHLLPGVQADNVADAVQRGRNDPTGLLAYLKQRSDRIAEMTQQGIKTCCSCGLTKRLEEFGRRSSRVTGRDSRCLPCRRARDASRSQVISEQRRERRRLARAGGTT